MYMEFYNKERPHETLKYLTPKCFTKNFSDVTRGVLVVYVQIYRGPVQYSYACLPFSFIDAIRKKFRYMEY